MPQSACLLHLLFKYYILLEKIVIPEHSVALFFSGSTSILA